jgi:hypothetical protein
MQRNFFLNGFDGFLREISFIVKIFPNLDKTITSVGIIRIIKQKTNFLFLVDHQLHVLGMEEGLFKALGCNPSAKKPVLFTHVKQLSKKLSYHLILTKIYLDSIKPHIPDLLEESKIDPDLIKMLDYLDFMYHKSESAGYVYTADQESPFFPTLQHSPFLVKFHVTDFKGIPYIAVYFSFQTYYKVEINHQDFEHERNKIISITKARSPRGSNLRILKRSQAASKAVDINSRGSVFEYHHEDDERIHLSSAYKATKELVKILRARDLIKKENDPDVILMAFYLSFLWKGKIDLEEGSSVRSFNTMDIRTHEGSPPRLPRFDFSKKLFVDQHPPSNKEILHQVSSNNNEVFDPDSALINYSRKNSMEIADVAPKRFHIHVKKPIKKIIIPRKIEVLELDLNSNPKYNVRRNVLNKKANDNSLSKLSSNFGQKDPPILNNAQKKTEMVRNSEIITTKEEEKTGELLGSL